MGLLTRATKVTPETVPPRRRRGGGGSLLLCCGRASTSVAVEPLAAAPPPPPLFSQQEQVTLIMLGCDDAGKTSLAAALAGRRLNELPDPTVGFEALYGERDGAALKILDVGGGPNIRGIWEHYFQDAHGAIFLVDASAPDRFAEASSLLKAAAANARLAGKPLLILANKQDQPHACGAEELAEALRVDELESMGTSCQVGAGHLELPGPLIGHHASSELARGLRWLLGRVSAEYQSLQERVEREVQEAKEAADKKKAERKARLAAKRAAREAEEKAAAEKAAAAEEGGGGEAAAQ